MAGRLPGQRQTVDVLQQGLGDNTAGACRVLVTHAGREKGAGTCQSFLFFLPALFTGHHRATGV